MAVRSTLLVLPLWLVLVDFWSNFANANLTVHPTDTEVLVNHSTYFNCSTSTRNIDAKYVLWYHYPLNSAPRKDVYDDGQIMDDYKERFGIETNLSTGVFNLVVNWPSPADAGKYECGDGVGHGDKASAELIILEGNPICGSNIHSDGVVGQNSCGLKPDELWMTCRITSFHGNNPPTLEWKKSDDESSKYLVVCERSTSCNLTQRGDQIRNGQSFVCQTAKSAEQYGCSIGPVKVKYAMSWTEEITEAKGAVVCSSNTSQPCTYKWYNTKNEEVSSDENLHTTIPGEYKCEAQCEMNRTSESCRFIAMRVYVVAPDYRLYALLVLLLIPIIICIIVFCLYKSPRCKKRPLTIQKTVDISFPPRNHVELKETKSLLTEKTASEKTEALMETPNETKVKLMETASTDAVDSQLSAELSSLPVITYQNMVDSLTINQHFIDRGTSGAIYGPFRWKDKKCALKQILFSPDALTKETEENNLQKANRCKELNHPHLVKVFEVWFPSPALYFVMEYAEGKSLDKILRPRDAVYPLPCFSLEIVQNWALQIADGMKYLHYNDLVHRNLKAAHVLVMELPVDLPYTLKLGSYTLITKHDHATVMSAKGTLAWMAPECIRSEPFSKLSDVWSYGVTVWEILTRDVPYKEMKKETDLVRAAINKTLKLKIPDSCPELLQDLLTGCLNHEVDKRLSFTEICDYLRSKRFVIDSSLVQHNLTNAECVLKGPTVTPY